MDPAVAREYPDFAAKRPQWVKNFRTSSRLCGAVCVFLATGAAKVLKGRYIDCEYDVQAYLDEAVQEEIVQNDLHTLRVPFAAGAKNDGGSSSDIFNLKD